MLRAGQGLMLIVISLLCIGVVMVTSAGLTVSPEHPLTIEGVLLGRTALLAIVSVGAMVAASRMPVGWLYQTRGGTHPAVWLLAAVIGLLMAVHVPGIGREVNGARRWILIGPVGFQPSEVAKWGMIIVLAWFAVRRAGVMDCLWQGFVPPMILVGVVCALIASEDLGTAVLIGLVSVAMLLAAGCKAWHAMLLMPLGALGFVAAVFASPYRMDRLRAFMDPYQDPQGIGYHILQSMGAIHAGGIAGRGLGNSVHKFGYLPEDTTDFIFAIICEELGVMGAAVVVCLYGGLLLCGLSIVKRAREPFQRLLGLGVLLAIGVQAVINIAVVTGSAPTKGIALPLLSSGGTGWVMTAFCIGLLMSMDRAAAREERLGLEEPGANVRPATVTV